MSKHDVLAQIREVGLVPVIRAESPEVAGQATITSHQVPLWKTRRARSRSLRARKALICGAIASANP